MKKRFNYLMGLFVGLLSFITIVSADANPIWVVRCAKAGRGDVSRCEYAVSGLAAYSECDGTLGICPEEIMITEDISTSFQLNGNLKFNDDCRAISYNSWQQSADLLHTTCTAKDGKITVSLDTVDEAPQTIAGTFTLTVGPAMPIGIYNVLQKGQEFYINIISTNESMAVFENISVKLDRKNTATINYVDGQKEYTLNVDKSQTSVNITPNVSSGLSAKVNNVNKKYDNYLLNEGTNRIPIEVTAKDGVHKETYTLIINRGNPTPTPKPEEQNNQNQESNNQNKESNNQNSKNEQNNTNTNGSSTNQNTTNNTSQNSSNSSGNKNTKTKDNKNVQVYPLKNLKISSGEIDYDKTNHNYRVIVSSDVTVVSFETDLLDGYTIDIAGPDLLEVGDNLYSINVLNSKNETVDTYFVTVVKSNPDACIINRVDIEGYDLKFNQANYEYELKAKSDSVKVNVDLNDFCKGYEIVGNEKLSKGGTLSIKVKNENDEILTYNILFVDDSKVKINKPVLIVECVVIVALSSVFAIEFYKNYNKRLKANKIADDVK